jgi:hypothetical protein
MFGTGAAALAVSRAKEAGQLSHTEQCKDASEYRLHSLCSHPVSLIVNDCMD